MHKKRKINKKIDGWNSTGGSTFLYFIFIPMMDHPQRAEQQQFHGVVISVNVYPQVPDRYIYYSAAEPQMPIPGIGGATKKIYCGSFFALTNFTLRPGP